MVGSPTALGFSRRGRLPGGNESYADDTFFDTPGIGAYTDPWRDELDDLDADLETNNGF